MDSLKSKEISWLKFFKYLASGVLVNNFMISRFGTYGPLFSFLKTIKMSRCQDECPVFLKKDHLGLVESSKNILSNIFFKNDDQMVFRKVHLGLESFSNILLELTVRRRWMSAVSEHYRSLSNLKSNFNCSEKMTNMTKFEIRLIKVCI